MSALLDFSEQLSIAPLNELLRALPAESEVPAEAVTELIDKFAGQVAAHQREANKRHMVLAENNYLLVLRQAQKLFNKKDTLSQKNFTTGVDKIMRTLGLHYLATRHVTVNPNFFSPVGVKGEKTECLVQDLAFYHPERKKSWKPSHHHYKKLPALGFCRCERFDDTMLFGNFQVEDDPAHGWQRKELGALLGRRRNINSAMLQAAVRHAVTQGYRRILFQCSDAVENSQWREANITTVHITPANIKGYQKAYQKAQRDFDRVAVGRVSYDGSDSKVVIEKTEARYKVCYCGHPPDQSSFLNCFVALTYNSPNKNYVFSSAVSACISSFLDRQPEQLLKDLDAMFAGIEIKASVGATPEKISALKEICRRAPAGISKDDYYSNDLFGALMNYFEKFGYVDQVLTQYPAIKRITIVNRHRDTPKYWYFENIRNDKCIETVRKKDILAPVLGESYMMDRRVPKKYLHRFEYHNEELHEIVKWYDDELPKTFKKLNLGCVKVPIANREITAHAWEINSGLEEFIARPATVFASRAALKLDCVPLPDLYRAAEKFGLTPSQIRVTNDFLAGVPAPIIGAYNRATARVTLANKSLSVFAHEATHHLVATGAIPAREYRALCAAGQRLVAARPSLQKELTRKDQKGHALYPPGVRQQEYAAMFVENYYSQRPRARKALLGAKITMTEKMLNYLSCTADALLSFAGSNPARARQFLRRVENNLLVSRPPQILAAGKGRPRHANYSPALSA